MTRYPQYFPIVYANGLQFRRLAVFSCFHDCDISIIRSGLSDAYARTPQGVLVLNDRVHGCRSRHRHHRGRRSTSIPAQEVCHAGTTSARQHQSELFSVRLGSQAAVDAATAQQQDLFERRPELAVEPGVDDGVEEAVSVAEPEKPSLEPVWNALRRIGAERLYEGQYEERQPAGGERGKDTVVCSTANK